MEHENTKILKELEANSDMSLIQGEKMVNAVDGLEPALEGILMKADELVRETKNKTPIMINIEGDVESIKGEKGDPAEIDYDKVKQEVKDIYEKDIKVFKDELSEKLQNHALSVQGNIAPVIQDEVDEKFSELVGVVNVEVGKVREEIAEKGYDIDELEKEISSVRTMVSDIKIPEYDFTPFAQKKDVEKEIESVKGEIETVRTQKVAEFDSLKEELKKEVDDAIESQNSYISRSSKTVSLVELDDVNLDGLTVTNGKYDLGSGGGSGADKEVMFAYLSLTQSSNVASNDHVEFDTISFQKGTGITLTTGAGQANGIFTLPAEKYFKITCTEAVTFSGSNGQSLFTAYNDTDNADIGMPGFALPYTNTQHATYPNMSVAYISTVGGAKDVYVRFVSNANVTGIAGFGDSISTYITIEEI